MKAQKRIGIWMDHHTAHIWDFPSDAMEPITVESGFTQSSKEDSSGKGEHLMHNKEQHLQMAYYKILEEMMSHCSHAVLFGPTEAKAELSNVIKTNQLFDKIQVRVVQSGKMTLNQERAFVKDHYQLSDRIM